MLRLKNMIMTGYRCCPSKTKKNVSKIKTKKNVSKIKTCHRSYTRRPKVSWKTFWSTSWKLLLTGLRMRSPAAPDAKTAQEARSRGGGSAGAVVRGANADDAG